MSTLQRELAIRKRVLDIYNKTQDQFSNDEEWFDYQELIEDHIFSLVEGQNVQQTESAIEAYRKANYDSIVANDAKKRGRVRPKIAGQSSVDKEATQAKDSNDFLPSGPRPAGFGQPQPIAPAVSHVGMAQMTADQRQRMASASGWNPSLVQKRQMQLALSGLLVK